MRDSNPIYGKISVTGTLTCESGLHIGIASAAQGIGGIDSPVVKDPLSGQPYIPGSSLKGKLRSLFERRTMQEMAEGKIPNDPNFLKGRRPPRIHICTNESCRICRLFGSVVPGGEKGDNIPSPLIVRDLPLENDEQLKDKLFSPLKYTEWKSENALDRITAFSNPRDIERVPRGAEFGFEFVYTVSNHDTLKEDMVNLVSTFCLLQDDFLGGSGSRGYGKVTFKVKNLEGKRVEYYKETDPEQSKYVKVFIPKSGNGQTMSLDTFKNELNTILDSLAQFFKPN